MKKLGIGIMMRLEKGKCPIVDTWWQTETGGILISPLAGITPLKPTYATLPLPGIQVCLVDSEGNEILGNDVSGNLCLKYPWPSMIRTTYGDHERCRQVYFRPTKENILLVTVVKEMKMVIIELRVG